MALFFAVTLFVSAFLLFLVQPMVGKMVLPLLGGAPAVWATCMVFFQALLLAGYAYAHATTRRLGSRRQSIVHLGILVVPLIVLGVTAYWRGAPIQAYKSLAPQGQEMPFFGAIALLAAAIGLPFFVVATSAPLLQRWFADTDHPAARDPYFLYAASNLGSLLALVCYPFFFEPRFTLATQGWLWSAGYLALVGLTAACAWQLRRTPNPTTEMRHETRDDIDGNSAVVPDAVSPVSFSSRLRWLALAFVPSSLLLSVTQFITTDIAPVPGLWVLPLAIYLLTFIVAFGRTPPWVKQTVELVSPLAILALLYFIMADRKPDSLGLLLAMHLVVFLFVALNCHMDLAARRPSAEHLTEFYLWVSLGGMLGGLFNSLIAPLIFNDLFEYQIVLVAACFLQPVHGTNRGVQDWFWNIAATLAVAGLTVFLYGLSTDWLPLVRSVPLPTFAKPFYRWVNFSPAQFWRHYVPYVVPLFVGYLWVDRPLRFGLCVAAAWLVLTVGAERGTRVDGSLLRRDRSFFGILAVQKDVDRGDVDGEEISLPDGTVPEFHRLVHGTTLHGLQQWNPPSDEPLTYYHRTGPIGQLFAARPPGLAHGQFAFVGLGSGSLASYGRPGETITFYEIDPAVRRIAADPHYFTYLHDSKAKIGIVMGDARLQLERYEGPKYGVIVVDAFSSDAIPIHLLTREALHLYFDKLADNGIVALHLSNRYLYLDRVVGRLVTELREREPNLTALTQYDLVDTFDPQTNKSAANHIPGKRKSQWVLLARHPKDLAALDELPGQMKIGDRTVSLTPWEPLPKSPDAPLWTDDFSNLTQILNWEQIWPNLTDWFLRAR